MPNFRNSLAVQGAAKRRMAKNSTHQTPLVDPRNRTVGPVESKPSARKHTETAQAEMADEVRHTRGSWGAGW
jgi:hypothetical protein